VVSVHVEFPEISRPDDAAREQARARQDRLTKPTGALGRLEEISIWLAGVQGRCPPDAPRRPAVVVFAGDHGVAAAGVSAYPSEVTAQMVANFLAGGAAVNVLADLVGATVEVADIAVQPGGVPIPGEVRRRHVRDGSGRIDVEDALTLDEAAAAVDAGRALADAQVDRGADLLVPGDMGIGNTTPATALIAVLAGVAASGITGRGTGVDDAALARKRVAVAAAAERGEPHADDPLRLVATIGGADIAAMAGFLAQAAVRRTGVLLDGVVSGAAALLADRFAPGAAAWWLAGHRSAEPAHAAALHALRLEPLIDLGLRLGEGSGALVAVPVLRAAAATLAGMATFAEAGVSDRDG
jgi:nicotinate-nucleotide--dimethylbenzimidazole phosphoribosyltransferase